MKMLRKKILIIFFIQLVSPLIPASPSPSLDVLKKDNGAPSANTIDISIKDTPSEDNVLVQVYYECLCPDCKNFDGKELKNAVLKLGSYANFTIYPYGNAETIEKDGKITFRCQHGKAECYGNKLHACAIDYFQNSTAAILFNSCLMWKTSPGSDDKAADLCSTEFGIDSTVLKTCAKGSKGVQLLKYYGEESKKANFRYVPYILINGKENDGDNFFNDLCAAFKERPLPCPKQ